MATNPDPICPFCNEDPCSCPILDEHEDPDDCYGEDADEEAEEVDL